MAARDGLTAWGAVGCLLTVVACASAPAPDPMPAPPPPPVAPQTVTPAAPAPPEPDTEEVEAVPPRQTHEVLIEAGGNEPPPPAGLAAAAHAERQRRLDAGTPMMVIDDKNLSQHATGSLTISGGTTSTSAAAPAADGPNEVEWRERVRSVRVEWAAAVEAIHDLEGRVASLRTRFYSTDDPYVRDGQVKPAWDHALESLAAARSRARELELELAATLDEGRRAGALPGWLRDGIDLEPKEHPYERPDRREPLEGDLSGEPVILDETGDGPG
jgi:hypothetical protein